MKRVIITGADGFIGSNFIKELVQRQVKVWAVIHPESQTKYRLEGMAGVHCVESYISQLNDRIEEFPSGADGFYHFAWQGVNANE